MNVCYIFLLQAQQTETPNIEAHICTNHIKYTIKNTCQQTQAQ